MASCNFIGLVKIYGEDVLQYIKGCEFHFRDSVNRHANKFGDESETFKKYALQLLMSSTPEAYEISCQQLKSFINTTTNTETCHHWLNWWNSRKEFIFCAFTSKEASTSNLAEFIHAGWKHRERIGVGLVEACLFGTWDGLLFESQIEGLATGSFPSGDGPCQGKSSNTIEEKEIIQITNTTILLKGSAILLVVRQEELIMLLRFVAPHHVLVLISRKMVKRFFANKFYLFSCIYSVFRRMTTILRRDIFQKAIYDPNKRVELFWAKFKYVVNRLSKVNKQ